MHSDNVFETSRTLPYPPEAVYGAFASADTLATWWGPAGFTNSFEVFEFRAGGRWKFVMHGPDGKNYANENQFVTLVPNSKIVIEHLSVPHFTLTVELRPVAVGTYLEWTQAFDDSKTALAVKHIVEPANEQNLDRLTDALSKQIPAHSTQPLY